MAWAGGKRHGCSVPSVKAETPLILWDFCFRYLSGKQDAVPEV